MDVQAEIDDSRDMKNAKQLPASQVATLEIMKSVNGPVISGPALGGRGASNVDGRALRGLERRGLAVVWETACGKLAGRLA